MFQVGTIMLVGKEHVVFSDFKHPSPLSIYCVFVPYLHNKHPSHPIQQAPVLKS